MAGFRKAHAEQAALKVGIYGPPGSGKTLTALMCTEGLSRMTGKRTAFVDTERGTDFYVQHIKERTVHPEAFDIDALYTRSITEVVSAVRSLKESEYSCLVLDSVTHIWEACIASYSGRTTRANTIPMQAWGKIKKPYKELMSLLLSSNMHVFILGRQGTEYSTDEETEELKAVGLKMKAEGETAYEPHILIRMERLRARKTNEVDQVIAYAEKDRTGVLSGRSFVDPTFESLCRPLLGLLGGTQATMMTHDTAAAVDSEALAAEEEKRVGESASTLRRFAAELELAQDQEALKAIAKRITPQLKASMLTADVAELRAKYQAREAELSGKPRSQREDEPDPEKDGRP